ncbi:MAG: hypothetical protein U0Y68_15730 [Blastocatellia bacterium]
MKVVISPKLAFLLRSPLVARPTNILAQLNRQAQELARKAHYTEFHAPASSSLVPTTDHPATRRVPFNQTEPLALNPI